MDIKLNYQCGYEMKQHWGYGYCPRCNRIFPKMSNNQKICSPKCRRELNNKNVHRGYYKDLDKMRTYKREQERKRRLNPDIVKNERKHRLELRQKVIDLLGKSCILCGSEYKIDYHEIHGKKHSRWNKYFIEHKEDFIPLCRICHRSLHKLAQSKNSNLVNQLLNFLSMEKTSESLNSTNKS